MFKLKYRNSVGVVEVNFDSYMELVFFVASNKIKDEDFVSITLGDEKEIEGIDNLYNVVADSIHEAMEAKRAESEEDDEEDDYVEDGDADADDEVNAAIRELDQIFGI